MKKTITIKIHVDTEHPAKQDWEEEKHFIENEIDDVMGQIADFTERKYKNCSGTSASGAALYTVSIKHIHQVKQ